ncbi:cytochrome c peroxidase [Candidatus Albibeggiatoa sp. nov. NOAA]|uniref:cytochrome-c peroxidase n=1 Tax=Candidatus Albibeggiatoa sp. nov. NOAA TaxID=3162724 RepID=UPI0032F81B8A|nr:c-type cytochrome [Thiotrichaceae bacterium]
MSAHVSQFIAFGLVAIIAGVFILIGIVRELAPHYQKKWLLGIAMGLGVITFSFKIAFVMTFDSFAQPILQSLPTQQYVTQSTNLLYLKPAPIKTEAYVWEALPNVAPAPTNNPTAPEKVALGKQLFFDKRLSADGSLSCASCHELSEQKGGSDGLSSSIGIHGQQGQRNAPTVLNAAFQRALFWDGRANSLEQQAIAPLINPIEMGMSSLNAVVEKVQSIETYRQGFAQVFPNSPNITIDNIAKAIAAYERTLITPNSAYDRFVKGDADALNAQQLRGMALFESTGCILCHSGANFSGASIGSDNSAYRIFPTVANTEYEKKYNLADDLGASQRFADVERGVWRIPSLRNVNRTAPYFHNGSVDSLEEAVRIMGRVQLNQTLSNQATDDKTLYWSHEAQQLFESSNQALTDDEVKDIVVFLTALDGELP